MDRQIIIIGVAIAVAMNLSGCSSSERVAGTELTRENVASVTNKRIAEATRMGMPNPAAVYCAELGYEYKIVPDDLGDEYGFCVFPDANVCDEWAFYRGKCGQEWSYCYLRGYDLKDLGEWQGWFKGAICIDSSTRQEIGTVFDLFVREFLRLPLP